MVDTKTLNRIEARVSKLKEEIDSAIDKPTQLANYFHTKDGMTLGRSITELTDFSMKTALLFFPFDRMMPKIRESLVSEQADEKIHESMNPKMSEGYRRFLADFLPRYDDLLEKGDINPPFPHRDVGRFLALHVLSLYSYIDVYTDELMNRLMQNERLLKRMVTKLETEHDAILRLKDLHRYVDSQEDALIKAVRRNLPRNLGAKIDFIVAVGGIKDKLAIINEKLGFTSYRRLLSTLIDLRNEFAHGEPCPEISLLKDRFSDTPIEDIWRGFLKNIIINADGPLVKAGIYGLLMEFLVRNGPMYSIILNTTIVALMQPLIVDAAISVILEKQ